MSERHHEWLSLVLEATQVGTWSWDLDANEVVWSDQVGSIFGVSQDEFGGTYEAFMDLVHPDDRDAVKQRIEDTLHAAADLYEIEHRIIRPDGTVRWIEDRGQVIQTADGHPTRMAGTVVDVTKRKEHEHELWQSKCQFEAVFNDPKILVGWLDLDGTLRQINPTAFEYTDVGRDAVIGEPFPATPWWKDTPAEDVQAWIERAAAGEYVEYEAHLNRPDGIRYWVNGTFRPVTNESGDVVSIVVSAHDITEQKEREQQLARYKQYTDDVLDAVDDIFYVISEDHHFQRWNASFRELIGYSNEEIASMHPLELFGTEDDKAAIEDALRKVFETGSKSVEAEIMTKDGTFVPYEFVSSRLEDPDGNTVEVGIGRDISERKQAEEELRASKEYAEGLIASMQDGFSVIDTEMRQVQVNDALCRMTGFSREELIDVDPPYPYWPPEERETIQSAFEAAIAHRRFESLELVFKRKNGARFPVLVTPSQLTNAAGEVVNYFSTMKDITERKRAEEALRESEAHFRTLVENTPTIFFAVDRDGVFTVSEGRQLARLGLEPGEVVGRSAFDVYANFPVIDKNIRRVLAGEEHTWRAEVNDLVFDSYGVPLRNEHGEITGAIGVATDVTERTRVARENARLVEDLRTMSVRLLETQEQERRRIARELHDEAGGLLTSLQMCLDTAIQHVPVEDDGASVIHTELQEAQKLTSTLSTQVRQMALTLRPSVLDDLGLAAALQSLVDWYAKHADLTVRLYYEIGERQRFAEAVETAAYRIVQEALTNASRYAAVEEVQVMVNVLDDHLRIHVIDEGVGFDLEYVQQEHGTVGLSSMRERAELLQGELEIATAPGEGTRISATLPTLVAA